MGNQGLKLNVKKDSRHSKWTIPYLRNKVVWPVFSRYIRMRDANWDGTVSCVTCGRVGHWKTMQAGHFIPGRMNAILFDERGVHSQCYLCNGPLKGNPRKYEAFMKKRYGQEVIDDLDRLSNTTRQFTHPELVEMWNHYKEQVAKLGGQVG